MRIAELAQRTGVSRHTLRYYEKEGLLSDVVRAGNNYRDYPEQMVQRVIMMRQLKALGFSLKEIREVMNALRAGSIDCAQGAALMAQKRAAVEQRIHDLRDVRRLLQQEQLRLERSAAAHHSGARP